MTVVERNDKLRHFIACLKCEVSGECCDDNCPTQYEAGNMGEIIENLEAISKALAQEPCEDAISRQAMHIELEKWIIYGEYKYSNAMKYLYDRIDRLPSVTPQPKTGHWIEHQHEAGENWEFSQYECSECHVWGDDNSDYCPNCGAEM